MKSLYEPFITEKEENKEEMDLCGFSCKETIDVMSIPCYHTYDFGFCGKEPPEGFNTRSTLYDLCPNECPGLSLIESNYFIAYIDKNVYFFS